MSDEKKRDKQTKPKNWVQRLAERFGYTKKVGEHKSSFEETKLGDTSVSILQDMKLQERLDVLNILMTKMTQEIPNKWAPKQKVKSLKERLDLLDTCIQAMAAPSARGGTYPRYSRLLHGWNSWYGLASSWITRVDIYFTSNDVDPVKGLDAEVSQTLSDNNIIAADLQLALVQHVFPDAKDVIDYCFKDEDIAVKAVTIVQNMMPPAPQGFGGSNIADITKNMGDNR
jgi:hypothetical protein